MENETGTFTDSRDGRIYKTVKIGPQIWMSENLDASKFRNGDPLPEIRDPEEWERAGKIGNPVWCYYDNDTKNGIKYNKLYNWYAVSDVRGLAPEGWHIPDEDEWNCLISHLGGNEQACTKMKSTTGWKDNFNGSNTSGFTGLPGGYRRDNGIFDNIEKWGIWWSSTEFWYNLFQAFSRILIYDSITRNCNSYKRSGLSVRCLRDIPK